MDECVFNSDSCDVNAVCSNTPGSYTCSCKAGYSGDGKICVGKVIFLAINCISFCFVIVWNEIESLFNFKLCINSNPM